jgi:hypothetical protein
MHVRYPILAGALGVSLAVSAVALAGIQGRTSAKPDLVVSSLSTPDRVALQGHGFRVSDRTRNIGSGSARATRTQYYLTARGQRTAVGRRSVPRLAPHRSSAGSAAASVPLTLEIGSYSLVACADGAGAAKETHELNNCRTAATKIFVKKPPPPV